jgi:probable Rubsico expression protein CbbX
MTQAEAETALDIEAALRDAKLGEVLAELGSLVGLAPVKTRIREIAHLLLIDKLRGQVGLATGRPTLHMSFTGSPGTGKTTTAIQIAKLLHSLGHIRKAQVVVAQRDDLVGQYVGHTAPKTKETLKRAMGGVLFIDEAYYLHRPENERDYGSEAIEILLQVMENQRDDLVVIFAGYKDRMEIFFANNPGLRSRIAHHIDFPDYSTNELVEIACGMLSQLNYRFGPGAEEVFHNYVERRRTQPQFANARSIRNALDRARLRAANRLVERGGNVTREQLMEISAEDILRSRVFEASAENRGPGSASRNDDEDFACVVEPPASAAT